MFDLSVIIVNYNTEEYILNCINSIGKNTDINNIEIIIIDNISGNGTFEDKLKFYKDVKYYNLNSNKGFGYACNRGVEKATGKVLLFLNPDIIVTKGAIDKLFKFITDKDNIGFVTGVLTDEDGNLQYFYNSFPGIKWEMKEALGISVASTINELNSINEIKDKVPFCIDWAHGACLMINSKVFNMTNAFDENIFLYYEDVDIQRQVADLGYKNYCYPDSSFIHFERSSVRSEEGIKTYYFYMHSSKIYYMRKYDSFIKRIVVRLLYLLGFNTKIIMLPFRKKYKYKRRLMLSVYFLCIAVYLNIKRKK